MPPLNAGLAEYTFLLLGVQTSASWNYCSALKLLTTASKHTSEYFEIIDMLTRT